MDHPLHTITYVADIDHVLVIMAHVSPPLVPHAPPRATNGGGETPTEGEAKYIPKMTCHVLDSSDVSILDSKMHDLQKLEALLCSGILLPGYASILSIKFVWS